MTADVFKNFDPWAKQKDVAKHVLNRLCASPQIDHPCLDYASAKQLAHVVQSVDKERLCQAVHVYRNFVRFFRNEKGSFGLACVVFDHVSRHYSFPDEPNNTPP